MLSATTSTTTAEQAGPSVVASPPSKGKKTYPLYFAARTPLFAKILCQGVSEFRGYAGLTPVGKAITIQLPHLRDEKVVTSPIVDVDRLFHESNWQRVLDFIYTSKSEPVRALLAELTSFQQLQFIRLSAEQGRMLMLAAKRPMDITSINIPVKRCANKAGHKLVPVFEVKSKAVGISTTREIVNGEHRVQVTTKEEIVYQLLFKNQARPELDEPTEAGVSATPDA